MEVSGEVLQLPFQIAHKNHLRCLENSISTSIKSNSGLEGRACIIDVASRNYSVMCI